MKLIRYTAATCGLVAYFVLAMAWLVKGLLTLLLGKTYTDLYVVVMNWIICVAAVTAAVLCTYNLLRGPRTTDDERGPTE
jgi:hypothetical protein